MSYDPDASRLMTSLFRNEYWVVLPYPISVIYKWRVWQKQVSRAGTSNYIPQYLWDVPYMALPLIPACCTQVLKCLPFGICVTYIVFKKEHFLDLVSTHYNNVTMSAMASQITSIAIVYSIVYSGADERKHESSTPVVVLSFHRCRYPGRYPGM